ncbi:MAG: iron ABC transporter permease [Caldilinea sp.]
MRRILVALLYALPILFLALFYLYPLLAIFRVSYSGSLVDAAAQAAATLASPAFWRLLWFTTWQAALSTLLTVLVGLPLAAIFARFEFPGKGLMTALLTIPFVMPTVVVAPAFLALVGRNGVLNTWLQDAFRLDAPPIQLEQTIWLILLVHVFYNVAIIIRTVGGFWANLTPSLNESAAVLGAPPWQIFRTITAPLLAPSILAAGLLVFLFCFTSFGVILILGGLRFATLEVEIYRQAVSYFNLPLAAFLSIVQLLFTFTIMVVYTRMQAGLSRSLRQRRRAHARRPANRRQWMLVSGALTVTAAGVLAPLVALAVRSFTLGGQGLTLIYYQTLGENLRQSAFFAPPISAIGNSLLYALATLAISLPLGVIAAYMLAKPRTRWVAVLDPLLLLPLGTSAVTLGFGYIVAMGPLRASPWLVPVAHSLIALPFVVRTFLPALRALDRRLHEAASILGAGPLRRWWTIDAPLLVRALMVSAAFAFAISLGEFGATLLIARPDRPTMPMVIYQALSRPGLINYGQALAMSTILMAVTAVTLILIERFRLPGGEEF